MTSTRYSFLLSALASCALVSAAQGHVGLEKPETERGKSYKAVLKIRTAATAHPHTRCASRSQRVSSA